MKEQHVWVLHVWDLKFELPPVAVLNYTLSVLLRSVLVLPGVLRSQLFSWPAHGLVSVHPWPGWIPSPAPRALLPRSPQQRKEYSWSPSQISTISDGDIKKRSRCEWIPEEQRNKPPHVCLWMQQMMNPITSPKLHGCRIRVRRDRPTQPGKFTMLTAILTSRLQILARDVARLYPYCHFKAACIQMSRIWDRISLVILKVLISLINFFMKVK